jgi:hypothetical protein
MRKLILLSLFALALAAPAAAQTSIGEVSFWDPVRGQLAIGGNYEFHAGAKTADVPLLYDKEFTVGIYGAWNLVPAIDLIAFSKYGVDNRVFNSALGVRYTIWSGKE